LTLSLDIPMLRAMSEQHAGGCLCGAVRYMMTGQPTSTNICYCTQCQRQTGAPMPAFASCRDTQLQVVGGEPASYRSSERALRQFCATCGSTLFWREDGSAEVDIFLGTFDEPSRLPPPQYAIWAAHRVAWLPDLDGVPTFAARRSA
jgi:hypothetical protein